MYLVSLVQSPRIRVWKEDYFPRKVRYLPMAQKLKNEVKKCGGVAKIEKIK